MKRYLHLLILLLLVACTANQTQVNSTNTPGPVITQSAEPTDLTPAATTTISPTVLPPTEPPIATNSDVPLTPTPITPTPQPDSTNLSVPTGQIVFLWNPEPIPPDDERGQGEIVRTNLYLASSNYTSDSWQISTLVEMYGQPVMLLSPDNTKVAILKYDDTNADGVIDTQRGFDIINIYTYALDNNILTPMTDNQFSSIAASWLPDSENLIYAQQNSLFLTHSQTPLSNKQLTDGFPDIITGLTLSPDGNTLAVNRFPNNLDFFYTETGQIVAVAEIDYGYQLNMKWSSNSQWLAITKPFNDGLFIIESNTKQVTEIYDAGLVFPAWSPSDPLLAFTYNSTIFFWDGDTKTQKALISKDYLSEPAWSPDGTKLATGFSEGDRSGILILDLASGSWQELNLTMPASQIIWSPDGQWLLFSSYHEDLIGLFSISIALQQPVLFLDTTGKNFPSNIFWLENTSSEN